MSKTAVVCVINDVLAFSRAMGALTIPFIKYFNYYY